VPPSKRVQFLYDCDRRHNSLLPWLQQLRRAADSSPSAKRDLAELCKVILAEENGLHFRLYSWSIRDEDRTRKRQLLNEVAVGSLQCERFDLFERATINSSEPLPPEAFQQLGIRMALAAEEAVTRSRYSTIPPPKTDNGHILTPLPTISADWCASRVEKFLRTLPSLSQQDTALTAIETGFQNPPTTLSQQQIDSFQSWLSNERIRTIATAVDSRQMRKVDGVTLANIVAKWSASSIENRYVLKSTPQISFPIAFSMSRLLN